LIPVSAAWALSGDLFNQREIVIIYAGLVDTPRYRPHAKAIVGGRP
jgi:hypothetical protein